MVTSARVQAYVMDDTSGVISDRGVGKSAPSGDASTYASVDRSTRDIIGSQGEHDHGADESQACTSMNTSSTIEPVSSDSQSSVAVVRQSRGNCGSRIFYVSNSISDGPVTQNVCTTSVITEPNLSPQSIADNIATLKICQDRY